MNYSKDNQDNKPEKIVDVEEVIRNKNPHLLKILPGFILRYLKRIIHENEINSLLNKNRNKFGLDFVDAVLDEFGVKIVVKGEENIPKTGKCIIASNHPLGGLDGVALLSVVGKIRKDLIFPVNDILLYVPNSKELFIPINKHGSNTENIKIINDTFASDVILLYFPAGLVSRKQSGKIIDLPWKKTFISKAKQFKRDIIPAYIDGRNSNFFYNFANLRTFLKIKSNIEMLYLVNETYKQKDKTVNIIFGKPIPYETFDKRNSYLKWAELMKEHVYNIGRKGKNTLFDIKNY